MDSVEISETSLYLQSVVPTSDDIATVIADLHRLERSMVRVAFKKELKEILEKQNIIETIKLTYAIDLLTKTVQTAECSPCTRLSYAKACERLMSGYKGNARWCATNETVSEMVRRVRVLTKLQMVNCLYVNSPEQSGLYLFAESEKKYGEWWLNHDLKLTI